MKINKKTVFAAAVSAAILLGGIAVLFGDDTAQTVKNLEIEPYKPPMITFSQLDLITNDLIESSFEPVTENITDFPDITQETTVSETENNEPVRTDFQVPDTLPAEVMQSLIDAAKSLNEAFPDTVGWLYIPDTSVNYPVLQGDDNDFYLHHAYDGGSLSAGSIFLDYRCESRLMNPVNVLYGHNMNNGSMFAGVLKFADSAYFDAHCYGWLATPETVYRIDFFSTARASCYDTLYDGSMSVDEWIPHIERLSVVSREVEYSPNNRFISLSTCSYEFQNARTILTGKLVEMGVDNFDEN